MKAEYKKVSDLLVLESEETLQAFEMIELKGGVGGTNIKNENCPLILNLLLCKNVECKCMPKDSLCTCIVQPPIPIISCTVEPIP